ARELFRTITAGASLHGMPSFAHLAERDRWALVAFVRELRGGRVDERGVATIDLPPRPRGGPDLARGAAVFRERCAVCHGERGDGKGSQAGALFDERNAPTPPAAFARGPEAFRGGSSDADVARVVLLGRPGTKMVPVPMEADDLWAVAAHVARLASDGL